jgi:hypothetical protein
MTTITTKPLTDTQRAILRDAAGNPDGLAAPPASLPPAPRVAVAKALLTAGLLSRVEDGVDEHARLAWKLGGEPSALAAHARICPGGAG